MVSGLALLKFKLAYSIIDKLDEFEIHKTTNGIGAALDSLLPHTRIDGNPCERSQREATKASEEIYVKDSKFPQVTTS